MTSLLQHGSSFGTTESNTISLRIVDEINFPKYAEIDIANLNGDRSATYSPHDEIRIIDDDVTGDPVIFRGRVENITTPTDAQFGSLVRITARDNLAELHMDFDNNTYSENGLDATLNAIIRGHSQQPISVYGIGLPSVGSNTANFESSSITGSWTVVGKNNTRTVLETLQDLVFEDPWGTTYQNTTNYGWNFYLDGDNNMHYHKLGAFPSAPSSNGLSVTYGLVTPNDYNKPMLPGASFDEIADDIITDVICHYNIGAVSYAMRLRRFTHGTVGGSGSPFAAGNTITGNVTSSTAVIQLVTSGALIVSNDNADEGPLEEFNNDSGSTDTLTDGTSGATATMVTTPSSEINGEVRLLELDPPDFHFSAATSQASAKQYVAQTASVYLKAGFIDISAETHAKGTIQTFDYPVFRRGGATTVVRAGNQIYVQNNIEGSIAGNYTVSRIEFVQSLSTTRATLLITDNNGKVFRKSKVEQASRSGKKSSSVAIAEAGLGHGTTYQTATASGYVPTEQYGTFRYATDGGGGSADVLAFLSGQTNGTPAASTAESSFWTMLSEANSATDPDGSVLILEPIVDYGGTSNVMNRAYLGYHNPLFGSLVYYQMAGSANATNPGFTFYASGQTDTGMYNPSDNILAFSAGGVGIYGVWSTPGSPNQGGVYPLEDLLFDMGHVNYNWRDLYINPTSSGSGTTLQWTATGLVIKLSSSIKYKENVETLDVDSSKIDKLRPVKFNYKDDIKRGDTNPNIGLIAEEVNEIYPELITYDEEGDPEGVKYHSLSVMLLDEVKTLRQEIKDLKEKI